MRLFTTFSWMLSSSNEEYINRVQKTRQKVTQPTIKLTGLTFADGNWAVIAPSGVVNLSQAGVTSASSRVLDLSCDGALNLAITQGGVTATLPIKGTATCPARVTMTLGPNVTAVSLTSTEGTNNVNASWLVAELPDITASANFPAV